METIEEYNNEISNLENRLLKWIEVNLKPEIEKDIKESEVISDLRNEMSVLGTKVHDLSNENTKTKNLIYEKNKEFVLLKAEIEYRAQALREERDKLALANKLLDFPKELVENHKLCSVCGSEMRPFNYADNRKCWGCQSGDNSGVHDWVEVRVG